MSVGFDSFSAIELVNGTGDIKMSMAIGDRGCGYPNSFNVLPSGTVLQNMKSIVDISDSDADVITCFITADRVSMISLFSSSTSRLFM